jgi:signal recognition particle subunit SRP54
MEEALESDQLKYVEAMILSMTKEERRNPDVINGSRRKRIARGSGTSVEELNQLLKQFNEMRTMIRQVSTGKGPWAQMARQYGGASGMPGMPALPKSGGGKKTGKAARKEKRKQKSRGGRR